jgi:hypothetical protein
MVSAALLVMLLSAAYLASIGSLAAIGWLHRQPYYQLPFGEIRLEPGPPPWYRGGRAAFLEAVGRSAHLTKPIARLDATPTEIAAMFRNYHWVEDVQVDYPPGGVSVHLRYRQPVAYVQLARKDQLLVDEKGTILPPADIDDSLVGPGRLPLITAEKLGPPADPTPGVTWKTQNEPDEIPHEDPRIIAAAKLAGYVHSKQQVQSTQNLPAFKIGEIMISDFERRRLFVLNDEGQTIWWRDAPGEERPGDPNADEKWEILRKWGESSKKRSLPDGDFWRFSSMELVPVCPHPGRPHQAQPAGAEGSAGNSARKAEGSG